MPTYEYLCESCGKTWEKDQRITEEAEKICPFCNEPKAKRLVSGGIGFQLFGAWGADGYSK